MEQHNKSFLRELSSTILAVVAVVAVLYFLYTFTGVFRDADQEKSPVQIEPVIQQEVIKQATEVTPKSLEQFLKSNRISIYEEGLVTPQTLISACENPTGRGVKDQQQCNKEIANITKVLEVIKQPASGWLYIKAAVSRGKLQLGPLDRNYDAIWIFLDDNSHSGHLFQSDSTIPRVSEDGYTELLFQLDKVTMVNLPYSEENPRNKREINFLEALSPGKHYIAAFISSLGYGKIQTLEIGFGDGNIKLAK